MKTKLVFSVTGIVWWLAVAGGLRADVLEMQNGDRYSGKVLAVTANTVVLNSENLGKINVLRSKVASLTFGGNGAAPKTAAAPLDAATTNAPAAQPIILANTNADFSAAWRQLGGDTNVIGEIRQQMLAGSPEAAGKYDEMVNGLLGGQMNLSDLRKQAETSAQQLRDLKRELGPDTDEALDGYLKILDAFIHDSGTAAGDKAPAP